MVRHWGKRHRPRRLPLGIYTRPPSARSSIVLHIFRSTHARRRAPDPSARIAARCAVAHWQFTFDFTLSRELDAGRIDAQLRDGVLKLRIPKHEQARPQRISVKVS